MSNRGRFIKAARVLSLVLLLLFIGLAAPATDISAAQSVEVSSAEELLLAVADDTVSAVAFTVSSVVLTEGFSIDRDISFYGVPTTIILEPDAQIKVKENVSLSLYDIQLESREGYAVSCRGSLVFGQNVTIAGDYGVLLQDGASVTSNGQPVAIAPTAGRALGVSPQGGRVTLSELVLTQTSGSTHLVYLHQNSGEVRLEGSVTLSSNNSNAIMCPNNGSASPSVTVGDNAAVSIYAPGASNTGGSAAGSAVDTKYGAVRIGDNATVSVHGSRSAINAASIEIGGGAALTVGCEAGRSSGAALYSAGPVSIGGGSTLSIGAAAEVGCGGIYADGGITVGDGCQLLVRCAPGAENAIYSEGAVAFGNDLSLNIRGGVNGIVCKNGVTTGIRCTMELSGLSGYGIKSDGKLIADKLYFGQSSTIDISADYCAVYSREAFHIDTGGRANLASSTHAPALWIDAERDAPGYVSIAGSNVTVVSGAGEAAEKPSGVYVVGAVTVEDNSVFYTENSADTAVTAIGGDVSITSGASMYTRSGSGLSVVEGDVRVSSGGALFSQGLRGTAVLVQEGVINLGERAVADLQGADCGAQIKGEGGLWISGAASFDIRSTSGCAVRIEAGSFSVEGIDRISVWRLAEDGNNAALWWTGAEETLASWEITAGSSSAVQLYADRTAIAPSGSQSYKNGAPTGTGTLGWSNAEWDMAQYSRIGMYKSRPEARSNTFNIPAGRSFSWWLYGESYDGAPATYQMYSSTGDGEFELGEDGHFTYTAPSYIRGVQSFLFTVTNSEGVTSEPAEIKIIVTASQAPIVYSTTFMTGVDTPLMAQLNLRDYDGAIADTLITRQPDNGALTLSSDGKFLYTPNEGFAGIDEFEFCSVDDYGDSSNTGYVSIVVGAESGIYASNDTYTTDSNTPITARLVLLDAAGGGQEVSASDAPGEEQEYIPPTGVRYIITERPQYGTFSLTEDGTVTYTPYEDFAGTDTFRYYAEDAEGNVSNEAVVSVAIIPSKRPSVTTGYFTCARNYYCTGAVQAEDIDGSIIKYELVSLPDSGILEFNDLTGEFTYTPEEDFLGLVSFTFTAMDDDGLVSGESVVYIETMTLINNLRETGRLTGVILSAAGILAAVVIIAVLLISAAAKRHRRELIEMQEYYRSIGYYDLASRQTRRGNGNKKDLF